MNNKYSDIDLWMVGIFALAVLLIGGGVVTNIAGFQVTQKALNEQCGTNYSLMQVALAGDNLSRLCQIKNQVVTVK
jgi:hypothetical protein